MPNGKTQNQSCPVDGDNGSKAISDCASAEKGNPLTVFLGCESSTRILEIPKCTVIHNTYSNQQVNLNAFWMAPLETQDGIYLIFFIGQSHTQHASSIPGDIKPIIKTDSLPGDIGTLTWKNWHAYPVNDKAVNVVQGEMSSKL